MSSNHKKMNILGITQGKYINVFIEQVKALSSQNMAIGNIGAYVSFAREFKTSHSVNNCSFDIFYEKEWEIFSRAQNYDCNLKYLKKYEQKLPAGCLWDSIICDRRLIYGPNAKFKQDYRCLYSHDFILALLDCSLEACEKLLDKVKPDLVLGFVPVTFGENLLLNMVKCNHIPCLQLRATKIRNYACLYDRVPETSQHIVKLYNRDKIDKITVDKAKDILSELRNEGLIYEGVSVSRKSNFLRQLIQVPINLCFNLLYEIKRQMNAIYRKDHHDFGFIKPAIFESIHKPITKMLVRSFLKKNKRVLTFDDLKKSSVDWAFFPMQHEPEIALQIYARPYHKDQIELMRNVAASLPAETKLLVKEHPRSMGQRPISYYKKLLQIPNLYFIDDDCPSVQILQYINFVTVINGAIGLEAALIGKPVILLGLAEYNILPDSMIRSCFNLYDLPNIINDLLNDYSYNEKEVLNYLCAIIDGSVEIDIYSVLLDKQNRHNTATNETKNKTSHKQIELLCHYLIKRHNQLKLNLEGKNA